MGRTHRILVWGSTSVGRWRGKTRWSLRSRRSISSQGEDNLDLNGGWSKSSDLLLHTISNTGVHGGATRHDGVVGGLVDTAGFHSEEGRLEEGLGGTESLVANGDDLAVGKLVGLLEGGGGSSGGHFLLEVKGDIAELL